MVNKTHTAVIAAHADGRVLSETWDLVAFALQLNGGRPENIEILVLGDNIDRMAEEIAGKSGIDVRAIFCTGLTGYSSEVYLSVLARELEKQADLAYVCAPHNSQGMDYAPALAARFGAACISGVNGIFLEEGTFFFQKDIYGGKIKANMVSHTATTVLTIQSGVFKLDPERQVSPGAVVRTDARFAIDRTRFLGVRKGGGDCAGIAEARVVVAAGRGIGEQDNMEIIHRLAELFPKSAVAGTRIVCDQGWLPYNRQVGVTGMTVAPDLYVACGISGASQHVMGMRGARFVVAINTDRQAAMFNEADICIVEDITTFIPLLLEIYQQQYNDNAVPQAPGNDTSGG